MMTLEMERKKEERKGVSWVQIPPEATHFHFFICLRCLSFFLPSFFLSLHLKCYHVHVHVGIGNYDTCTMYLISEVLLQH